MSNATTGNPLLSKKSLHLSLSPPIFPDNDETYEKSLLTHPHFINHTPVDLHITRLIGRKLLSTKTLHRIRDSGTFRTIVDMLVTLSVPALAILHPNAVQDFFVLSKPSCMSELKYGRHPMQVIHLFEPQSKSHMNNGVLFFVHGGAWGSGMPWMYRLVAKSFIDKGLVVAIVGYRTYPCANISGQVHDLELAASYLAVNRADLFHHGVKKRFNENDVNSSDRVRTYLMVNE